MFSKEKTLSTAQLRAGEESWDVSSLLPGLTEENLCDYLGLFGFEEKVCIDEVLVQFLAERGLVLSRVEEVETDRLLIHAIADEHRCFPISPVVLVAEWSMNERRFTKIIKTLHSGLVVDFLLHPT